MHKMSVQKKSFASSWAMYAFIYKYFLLGSWLENSGSEVLGVLTVFCMLFEILIVYMSNENTVPMKKIYTEKYLIIS